MCIRDSPGQVKGVTKTKLGATSGEVNRAVHHHGVVAQIGVRVTLVEAVVHEQWLVVVVRHPSSNIQDRVFVNAEEGFEPNHHRSVADGLAFLTVP